MRIRQRATNDPVDISDFIKAAPEKPEEMYAYILEKAENFQDEDLKKLCVKMLTENKDCLLYTSRCV